MKMVLPAVCRNWCIELLAPMPGPATAGTHFSRDT